MVAALSNNVEVWSNAAANAAEIAAIAIGGWWAYDRFIRAREKWPRATFEQRITHRQLDDTHVLMRLDLKIQNAGEVLLELTKARAEAYQVLPLAESAQDALAEGTLVSEGECEADWPCLVDYERQWEENQVEIEPQEADELGFDFVIPSDIKTLFLYCYVWNARKHERDIGWPTTTFYDLDTASGEKTVESRELTARS